MIPSRTTSGVLALSLALLASSTPNAGSAARGSSPVSPEHAKQQVAIHEPSHLLPQQPKERPASAAACDEARVEVTVFEPPPPPVLEHEPLIRPVEAPVASPYGMRTDPVTGVHTLHTGTDYGAS